MRYAGAAGHPRPHVVNDVNMGNSLEIIAGSISGRQKSHSGEMERGERERREREELHFCDFCKRGEKAAEEKSAEVEKLDAVHFGTA